MSTERTRAPSFASRAASGLPTTSDLPHVSSRAEIQNKGAHLLTTVMTFPLARSPYASILLYTPRCSNTLTIARGVHGKMDLTVPSGAVSES